MKKPKKVFAVQFPGHPIASVTIEANMECQIIARFTSAPVSFLTRLKLAFYYFWMLASGRLEYAVLAKVRKP